ncbi:hypothetical protein ScalyP_jg133 [Parmales sp. scaly parma]|nr:hypothetical protein ScalyP_jg133 [Parmales sp. scaly parma]
MHAVQLTIPPNSTLLTRPSLSLEMWYVISGSGLFIKNNLTNPITSNMVIVVNPSIPRSVKNATRSPLVLLRCCDGGKAYDDDDDYDCIAPIQSKKRRSMDFLLTGLSSMGGTIF